MWVSRGAKLNDVDPKAWFADVLARIADTATSQLPDLLPWRWKADADKFNVARLQPSPEVYGVFTGPACQGVAQGSVELLNNLMSRRQ